MTGMHSIASPLTEAQRREWTSIVTETDPALRDAELMAFAAREEAKGEFQVAVELYQDLPKGRERLAALLGQGGFGNRVEILLRQLVVQATEPSNLVALGLAAGVAQLTRLTLVSRYSATLSPTFLTRCLGISRLASLGAFALEVPVFTFSQRLADQALGRITNWNLKSLARDLGANYLVFGAMQGSGALGAKMAADLATPMQGVLRQAALFTGILLGHRLELAAGLRQANPGDQILADSLALLLQSHVSGSVLRLVLDPEISAWRNLAELRSRAIEATPYRAGPAWAEASAVSIAEPPRYSASMLQMSSQGSEPEAHSWIDRLRGHLPSWLGGRTAARPEPSSEHNDPYRSRVFRFSTPKEARREINRLWGWVLNSELSLEFRSKPLADLQGIYRELKGRKENFLPEIVAGEPLIRAVVRNPKVKPNLPKDWPDILLQREIALPEEVAQFYQDELHLRSQAAHFLAELHLEVLNHPNEIRKAATFLEETVREPRLSTKFRTYLREDVWSRSFFQAERQLRQELFRAYAKLLPRLPKGSVEAEQGCRLLTEKSLRHIASGEGPIPDYLTDPAWVLDLMRAHGALVQLLPRSNEALKRADQILEPLLLSLGQRAKEGEVAAIEVLGLYARSDPSAKGLLEQIAEGGDPNARNQLAKLP